MLLSKYAYVKIAPINSNYWKGLGYNINSTGGRKGKNTGQRIRVMINHLQQGSNVNVSCRCDNCNKKYIQRYSRNKEICSSCRLSLKMKNNNHGTNNKLHDIPNKEDFNLIVSNGKQYAAKYYNVSISVINGWMKRHDIKIKPYHGSLKQIPDTFIFDAKILSLTELKTKYNVSYKLIKKWLSVNSISLDGITYKKEIPAKHELLKMNSTLDSKELAKLYNTSQSVIIKWFKQYDITLKKFNVGISKSEQTLIKFVNDMGGNFVSKKGILENPYLELDGYDKTLNIAIEYCGLYWHSSAMNKDKNVHHNKWKQCLDKNITLVTIFENEWLNKPEIVKSILLNKIGKIKTRIFARKCTVKEISSKTAKIFHDKNHLSGYVNSSINIGLFFNDELVSVMSFRKSRYDKNIEYEISRFSSLLNTIVVGGGSKLLKFFERQYNPKSLISYSDLRLGLGNCYKQMGFGLCGITPPNYFYFHKSDRHALYSRISFQKFKLKRKLEIFDNKLTETENMKNNGYYKIYDCGNMKYKKIYK